MLRRKSWLFLIVIALAAAGAALWWNGSGHSQVTIINVANFHSQLLPFEAVGPDGQKREYGGAAWLGPAIRGLKARRPGALVTETGDWVTGSWWRLFNGEPEFKVARFLGIDVGALGNHEWGLGPERLKDALDNWLGFPVLSTNLEIKDRKLDSLIGKDLIITDGNGFKVGFFSLITPRLDDISSPGEDVTVRRDLAEVARMAIADLKAKGAQAIILLSHCPPESDMELARKVRGIGAIINGYADHGELHLEWVEGPGGWQTPVCFGESLGRSLGLLTLTLHRGQPQADRTAWQWVAVDHNGPKDEGIADLVSTYGIKIEGLLSEPIGHFAAPVDATKAASRSRETPLGDFLADALRLSTGARVGLMNAGGIRGDRVFPAGPVSLKTVFAILPFKDTVWVKLMKGSDLRQALELSASALVGAGEDLSVSPDERRTPPGGFLHISGLRVALDLSRQPALVGEGGAVATPGERVVSVEILNGEVWAPLNDGDIYTVAMLSFLAGGGDNYRLIKDSKGMDTQRIDSEVAVEYIKRLGGDLNLAADGRQVLENAPKR